eukprot:365329-Chlamydomonas_euryale.AAC.4
MRGCERGLPRDVRVGASRLRGWARPYDRPAPPPVVQLPHTFGAAPGPGFARPLAAGRPEELPPALGTRPTRLQRHCRRGSRAAASSLSPLPLPPPSLSSSRAGEDVQLRARAASARHAAGAPPSPPRAVPIGGGRSAAVF